MLSRFSSIASRSAFVTIAVWLAFCARAVSQVPEDFYRGRTITISVGLSVGGTGSPANAVAYPRALNAVLGTRFRVITGYPGSAEALIAMERGETHGFCSMGFATLESIRPDWVRDRRINQLVQLAVKQNP